LGTWSDITERKRAEEALRETEGKYRTLFEGSSQGILATDTETNRFMDANPSICRMLGYTMEELLRLGTMEIHPQEAQDEIKSGMEDQRQKGRSLSLEVPCMRKDSTIFYADISGATTVIHGRRCVVGFFVDVTERKQAEDALRGSEAKYRTLVENIPQKIFMKDRELKFLSSNEIFARDLGIRPADIVGKTDYDFYPKDLADKYRADDLKIMETRQLEEIEEKHLQEGRETWVHTIKTPVKDANGEIVALLGIFWDITERKQGELVREALYTISQAAVTENLEDFYLSIHHALGNLMSVDNFYIALYDPDTDLLSFPYSVDKHDASYSPQKPGRGLTEYILRTGRSLLVDRQAFTQLVQKGEVELVGSDSVEWLGVPLKVGEKIFGVIAVQSYTESVRFSHANMEMLEFVSAQVSTFIERKLIQQRITDALELNLTLINTSSLGISAYDSSGQCILANKAIARILGATREQVLGQNYNSIESWKKSELLEAAREAVASNNETRREIHTITDYGKEVWLDCHFTPFVSNGEPHLLRTDEDISIAKQAEIALQAYAAKLEQSNRDLQEFAYVASHDLQEPLRKVLAFSDLIVTEYGDAIDETGRDYLNRMQGASQRMQTLIYDLLNFSRVETRAQAFTEVDLNTVAQEVVSDLENSIENAQGRVEIGKLPTIDTDPTQMHQLLQNLISNALKFHHEGCSPLVKISAEINGDACQISVEDNGIGLNIQYLDRIFKPFERLHSREEYEGSGMGLAICRRIVERHSGRITAISTPGEGSTFIVTLPIHQSKGDSSDG
jgi:PAS domain S-box-containing protein